ncbi:MAG: hypothetical protein ABI443_14445 [Chthoniobacterales bacterium]
MAKSIVTSPRAKDAGVKVAASPPTNDLVVQLRKLISRNTRRWKRLIIFEALGLAIAIPLGYFLLVVLLDNVVHLPTWGRITACIIFLGAVAGFGAYLMRQWWQARFTEDQVALAMEKGTPGGVQNRLINAIQIAREGNATNSALNQALIQENYQRLKSIEIQQAGKFRPAFIRMMIASFIIIIGLGFWTLKRQIFTSSAIRIMNPFSTVAPIYRTVLTVTPGNVQSVPGGDVKIQIGIKGEIPSEITIRRIVGETRSSETIAVPAKATSVPYTFKNLQRSLSYIVDGGDFSSTPYQIDIPTPPLINLVRIHNHFPDYTKLPDQNLESAGGDIEALYGTHATLTFVLDQPADRATLLLNQIASPAPEVPKTSADAGGKAADAKPTTTASSSTSAIRRIELKKTGPAEFTGEILFQDVLGYQIETQSGSNAARKTATYGLRTLADQAPTITLMGLDRQNEVQIAAALALKVSGEDDYGLSQVGIFFHKTSSGIPDTAAAPAAAAPPSASPAAAPPVASPAASNKPQTDEDNWQEVKVWPVANAARTFQMDYTLPIATLNVAEGDQIEISARGRDNDPLKGDHWTSGETYTLLIGGEGVALQVLYEHILKSEADIRQLIVTENQAVTKANEWIQKLDPASGLRWDDKKNLDGLSTAMREQTRMQEDFHKSMGRTARDLVDQASSLRLPLGLLADTEVPRTERILDAVPARDTPQDKHAALLDARITMERCIRSLNEISEQYTKIRQDWELANMMPFIKMLANRETSLGAEAAGYKDKPPEAKSAEALQRTTAQRQTKLLQLSGLVQVAVKDIGARITAKEGTLGKAYTEASGNFDSSGLKTQMQQAIADITAGHWTDAAPRQAKAAEGLNNIYDLLKKSTLDAAQRAVTKAQEEKKSNAKDAQAMKPGDQTDIGPAMALDDKNVQSLIKTLGSANKGKLEHAKGGEDKEDPSYADALKNYLSGDHGGGEGPKADQYKLMTEAMAEKENMVLQDVKKNAVNISSLPDKLEDVVGDLLDEAEKVSEKYQTLNATSNEVDQDVGAIGKSGGKINSTGASQKTGNQKPPGENSGGASGIGRQGSRANGLAVGDTAPDMRGRDETLEGDENINEQGGKAMKEQHTNDEQKGVSEGRGGKKVNSDNTQFSDSNRGQFDEKVDTKNMGAAQKKVKQIDRAGQLDPKVAAMLRDLKGSQDQIIERVNALKKEFKDLYLPTERLDELSKQLVANLEKMKESPDADFFKEQEQILNQLRTEAMVFGRAVSNNQPSVPRNQAVQGRVMDEPPSHTNPGYQKAVSRYYETLTTQ